MRPLSWVNQQNLVIALALSCLSVCGCGTAEVTQAPDDAVATDIPAADSEKDSKVSDTGVQEVADTPADSLSDILADSAVDAAPPDVAPEDAPEDVATPPDTPIDSPDIVQDTGPISKTVHSSLCKVSADCKIPCATGTCDQGKCSWTAKANVCAVDLGADQVGCFPAGGSSDKYSCLACLPNVAQTKLSSVTGIIGLDSTADGVAIVDVYKSGISWNFDGARNISGGKSLYFGDPLTHNYFNNKKVAATATLPPLAVPSNVGVLPHIAFWLWLDTEETPDQDVLTLTVVDGAASKEIWSSGTIKGSTHGVWQHVEVDAAAYAGKSVQLLFAFDSKDAVANSFEGAYIDDVSVSSGCCGDVSDCDDGNACSTDSCAAAPAGLPVCSHKLKADCCASAADCDDKQACTLDLCPVAGGACVHSNKPDCCLSETDCDDKNPCTADVCPKPGGQCLHGNTCCKGDAECKSSDPCMIGSCNDGACSFNNSCCSGDGDCDDFNPCTKDACSKGKCVYTSSSSPGCCSPTPMSATFGGSDEGFTLTSTNADPGVGWHYKAVKGQNGDIGVLAFGHPKLESYSVSNSPKFVATAATGFFNLMSGKDATLTFQLQAVTPNAALNVRIYTVIDGAQLNLTATKNSNVLVNNWVASSIDLSPLAGKAIQVFFEVTLAFNGNVTNTQIYLDDVIVSSSCQAKKCSPTINCNPGYNVKCTATVCSDGLCVYPNNCCKTAADCSDGNLCTSDACSNGFCPFSPIVGCCMGNGDCNDNNACTIDTCSGPGGKCVFSPIGGCCLSSAQCDDKNACTVDTCSKNVCSNANTCCAADKDCDDGEVKCSIDTCVNKACVHKSTGAPGCCTAELYSNDFDKGDPKGFVFSNSAGAAKGWQLWGSASESKTPPGALYYGDPGAGNYDFGASNGTATWGKLTLPSTTVATLQFYLYMDTEGGTYDDLTVSIIANGGKAQLWKKSSAGFQMNNWQEMKFDLSPYKDKEIQIEFLFNTGDSIANGTKGVFVDDVKVLNKCD